MKRLTCLLLCLFGLTFCVGASAAPPKGNPGFEKMKMLVGEWEGKTDDGSPVQLSYRLVSGGSALMETLRPANEPEMVTMYTADGDRVAMTHYCSMNNQPHLQTGSISGNPQRLDFSFVSATNLASSGESHIHHLLVTFDDKDHFTQNWTWRENGKDQTGAFHFSRKKSS